MSEDKELKWTTYKTNQVFLDEGWYSKEYLQTILDAITRQEKHTKEMMGE